MCGLAGIFNYDARPLDLGALVRMREAMITRGPDGAGLWISQNSCIGLAHRRLAILDLSERGGQPMATSDAQVQVVLNGEIYNNPELREWCEAHGARYRSDTDTETLLHLYALDGPGFVKRLRGMFSFALWDARSRTVMLARDPFGIKPLYYTAVNGQFRFASQVKALLAGGIEPPSNPAGIVSFLLWGYVTEPHTWYRSIYAVPAGSLVMLRSDGQAATTYYQQPLEALRDDACPRPSVSSLRDAMLDCVRHHLLADVPVGLFLSAGIDSGTLCALVKESNGLAPVRTVTLGFGEYAGSADDEVPLARAVASRYDCRHTVVSYRKEDFQQERERLLQAMDQPTVDGVNTYFVSKAAAAAGLKAALSGVGGDELFGGYSSFWQVPQLARALHLVPRKLGKQLRSVLSPIIGKCTSPKYAGLFEYGGTVTGAYLLRRALFMPWEVSEIVGTDTAITGLEALDVMSQLDAIVKGIRSPFHQIMALEHAIYLKNCLLRDADWAGMAHSLEIRTPLVDATLFASVLELCSHRSKPLGKVDFARTPKLPLPADQQRRPKTGFNVPIREWLMVSSPNQGQIERGRRGWARYLAQRAGVLCKEAA
jgi:asparagine synthase (glutamine-hydrolysing)